MNSKAASVTLLVIAEVAGMSLWFALAAVLPDLAREHALAPGAQALLSSAVQGGFVLGALAVAITGVADRLDPRAVFAASALGAALLNLSLLILPPEGLLALASRAATGALLAGVYPVGMKIAVGWGVRDRGLLIGLVVGGLTLGKALPYLAAYAGGTNWRVAIVVTSLLAATTGLLILATKLGPHHARAPAFRTDALRIAWTDIRIRRAYLGYLGHMWELYVVWAWIGAATAASYAIRLTTTEAESLGKLTAFLAIGLGAPVCVLAGALADRIGKAEVTIIALGLSGSAALLTALSFGGPVWVTMLIAVFWGIAVIPDSAQFSALVADNAPPELSGSLLTFQTALGFSLTAITVPVAATAATAFGWPIVLVALALGPMGGIAAMRGLRRV